MEEKKKEKTGSLRVLSSRPWGKKKVVAGSSAFFNALIAPRREGEETGEKTEKKQGGRMQYISL